MTINERLADLESRGFDQSYALRRDDSGRFTRTIRAKCSQCEALCINGVACHETGCRNVLRNSFDEEN